MARYQGARTDGLFGIIGRILGTTLDNLDGTDGKWADRLALAGKGFDLKQAAREVGVQPRTNSKRSEAKSGQQSNVGTAPTLPAQQKGQQPNVGTAPTQPAKPKDLAEPAKGSEVKRTKTPDVNRMSTSDKGKLTVAERQRIQQEISERSTIRKDLVRRGASVLEANGIDHVASNHKSVVAGLKRVADDPRSLGQAEAKRLLDPI
jgi:hypothetical protein